MINCNALNCDFQHTRTYAIDNNQNKKGGEHGCIVSELPAAIPFLEMPSIVEIALPLVLSYAATEPIIRMKEQPDSKS